MWGNKARCNHITPPVNLSQSSTLSPREREKMKIFFLFSSEAACGWNGAEKGQQTSRERTWALFFPSLKTTFFKDSSDLLVLEAFQLKRCISLIYIQLENEFNHEQLSWINKQLDVKGEMFALCLFISLNALFNSVIWSTNFLILS